MTKTLIRSVLLAVPLLGGCTRYVYETVTTDPIAVEDIAIDLYLIGDAGAPHLPDEPVLVALTRMIEYDPNRTFVVWLGDNLYPDGLPDSVDVAGRPTAEAVLDAQLDVMRETGTRGIFVPGNHDWQAGGPTGWETLLRQKRYIDRHGDDVAELLPGDGCPGPVVRDVGEVLRLVLIDTQWWLHTTGPRPYGGEAECDAATEAEVVAGVRTALADADGRFTVVAGHHPILSGGEHGGYFDWPAYLIPGYPQARRMGWFAPQDVGSAEYREMIRSLQDAFTPVPPSIYAAGHEHNLQLLNGDYARYLVVSGTGIFGHTTPVRVVPQSIYARAQGGFVRVSIRRDGWARVGVIVVDAEGGSTEDFSFWIDPPAPADAPPVPAAAEGR